MATVTWRGYYAHPGRGLAIAAPAAPSPQPGSYIQQADAAALRNAVQHSSGFYTAPIPGASGVGQPLTFSYFRWDITRIAIVIAGTPAAPVDSSRAQRMEGTGDGSTNKVDYRHLWFDGVAGLNGNLYWTPQPSTEPFLGPAISRTAGSRETPRYMGSLTGSGIGGGITSTTGLVAQADSSFKKSGLTTTLYQETAGPDFTPGASKVSQSFDVQMPGFVGAHGFLAWPGMVMTQNAKPFGYFLFFPFSTANLSAGYILPSGVATGGLSSGTPTLPFQANLAIPFPSSGVDGSSGFVRVSSLCVGTVWNIIIDFLGASDAPASNIAVIPVTGAVTLTDQVYHTGWIDNGYPYLGREMIVIVNLTVSATGVVSVFKVSRAHV